MCKFSKSYCDKWALEQIKITPRKKSGNAHVFASKLGIFVQSSDWGVEKCTEMKMQIFSRLKDGISNLVFCTTKQMKDESILTYASK